MYTYEIVGHFDAAHFLPKHKGACRNMHGHRWEYRIIIAIPAGTPLPENGLFVDFADVKMAAEAFDHKLINDHLATPTAEVIAKFITDLVADMGLPDYTYVKVKISESPSCAVMYGLHVGRARRYADVAGDPDM